MQEQEQQEHCQIDYTLSLTDIAWLCSLKGMARLKDIMSGISSQTSRKLSTLADNRAELNQLLGAFQRYRELSARIESDSESARIGLALMLNVPTKTHPDINPYPLSAEEMQEMDEAAKDAEIVPETLDLGQYPLWKIMREILRQVPDMRVYELEAHLKAFGIPAERSAIESSINAHRRQFPVTMKGREKFVAWQEGVDEAEVQSRKIATTTRPRGSGKKRKRK